MTRDATSRTMICCSDDRKVRMGRDGLREKGLLNQQKKVGAEKKKRKRGGKEDRKNTTSYAKCNLVWHKNNRSGGREKEKREKEK